MVGEAYSVCGSFGGSDEGFCFFLGGSGFIVAAGACAAGLDEDVVISSDPRFRLSFFGATLSCFLMRMDGETGGMMMRGDFDGVTCVVGADQDANTDEGARVLVGVQGSGDRGRAHGLPRLSLAMTL